MLKIPARQKIKKYAFSSCALILLIPCLFMIFSCSNIKIAASSSSLSSIYQDTNTGSSNENTTYGDSTNTKIQSSQNEAIYFFDYTSVSIEPTQSIDLLIKNCNIYLDIYGDMVVLGEIENSSNTWKTNMEITFNFIDSSGREIDLVKIPALANYLQPKSRMPFYLVYGARSNYINISRVKIGTNFKNYNKSLKGLPVITEENHSFKDKIFNVNGKVTNIGESSIEDLKVFCTFYNLKDQVVFIRKCYIGGDEMEPLDIQDFKLSVLKDEYVGDFTHYRFGAFFRDSLKIEDNKIEDKQ